MMFRDVHSLRVSHPAHASYFQWEGVEQEGALPMARYSHVAQAVGYGPGADTMIISGGVGALGQALTDIVLLRLRQTSGECLLA